MRRKADPVRNILAGRVAVPLALSAMLVSLALMAGAGSRPEKTLDGRATTIGRPASARASGPFSAGAVNVEAPETVNSIAWPMGHLLQGQTWTAAGWIRRQGALNGSDPVANAFLAAPNIWIGFAQAEEDVGGRLFIAVLAGGELQMATSSYLLPSEQWSHWAVVREADSVRLYANGRETVATLPLPDVPAPWELAELMLGAVRPGHGGVVTHLGATFIWSAALPEAKIHELCVGRSPETVEPALLTFGASLTPDAGGFYPNELGAELGIADGLATNDDDAAIYPVIPVTRLEQDTRGFSSVLPRRASMEPFAWWDDLFAEGRSKPQRWLLFGDSRLTQASGAGNKAIPALQQELCLRVPCIPEVILHAGYSPDPFGGEVQRGDGVVFLDQPTDIARAATTMLPVAETGAESRFGIDLDLSDADSVWTSEVAFGCGRLGYQIIARRADATLRVRENDTTTQAVRQFDLRGGAEGAVWTSSLIPLGVSPGCDKLSISVDSSEGQAPFIAARFVDLKATRGYSLFAVAAGGYASWHHHAGPDGRDHSQSGPVIAALDPDVVLIDLGVNDLGVGYGNPNTGHIGQDVMQYRDNILGLIEFVRTATGDPDLPVVLLTPMQRRFAWFNRGPRQYNVMNGQLAALHSIAIRTPKVLFANTRRYVEEVDDWQVQRILGDSGWGRTGEYHSDDSHYVTDAGARAWSRAVAQLTAGPVQDFNAEPGLQENGVNEEPPPAR